MNTSGRPNALSRLRRNRLASVGVVAVGSLAILSAGLSDAIHVRLLGQVDANWRGAYDILVRPSGARLDLERTNGLVEPNFLSYSGHGGISLGQLAAIRSVPGVEIAAPVSFLGYLRYATSSPTIQLTALPSKPTLYQATITITTSDGLSDRLLQRETGRVLLGPAPTDPSAASPWAADFVGMTYGVDGSGNPIVDFPANHSLPPIAIPVMAVDPVAEQHLLGSSATFLDPLETIPNRDNLTVANMEVDRIPAEFGFATQQIMLLRDPHFPTAAAKTRPIVPLVLSDSLYAGLKISLEVSQLGTSLSAYPSGGTSTSVLDSAQGLAGPGSTAIGRTVVDAGAELRPFQPANLVIAWPGSSPLGGALGIKNFGMLEARLSERPSYVPIPALRGSGRPSFRIEPLGLVGPDDAPTASRRDPSGPTTAFDEGVFPAYRSFASVPLAVDGTGVNTSNFDSAFVFAPLGTFDLGKLDLPDNPLTHVPLGAYAAPDTALIADPSGAPISPKPMTPTLSPAGFIARPPLAITDLAAATLLRGSQPIDAVRVRVAGLSGFDRSAQDKVEAIAARIAALGLDVDIVAGSSPQAIDLYVPEYDVSTDPAGDLGWVSQAWTTLGAAQRVEIGLGQADGTLLALGLLASVMFALGLQVLQLAQRSQQMAIQRAIGWTRREVLAWFLAEAIVASALIAALAGVGWFVGGRSTTALGAGLLLSGTWLLVATLGVLAADRSTGVDRIDSGEIAVATARRLSLPVRNLATYILRSAVSRPTRTTVEIVGLFVAGTTAGLSVASLAQASTLAGPTLLAASVEASLGPMQLGLLATSAFCSLVFVLAAIRLDLVARLPELEILEASGWSTRSVAGVAIGGQAIGALPAAIGAGLAAASIAANLRLDSLALVAAATAVVVATATPLAASAIVMRRIRR